MPNPPNSYTVACAAQGSTNPIATLAQGQNFPVNFSGVDPTSTNNDPSTFSVGGWMRLLTADAVGVGAGTVFVANGQLTITMYANGVLTVALGNTLIESDIPIRDVNWHYVIATYLPTAETNETGILTLYIDGLEAAEQAVNVTTPGAGSSGCFLGPQGPPFEFGSWSIWSQALPSDVVGAPQWGDPPTGTDAANGLVAAFDFANGTPADLSGNSYQVSVAAQSLYAPSLQINEGTALIPSSSVNPGGGSGTPAAFTIMGWVCVPSIAGVPNGTNFRLFSNNNSALRLGLYIDLAGGLDAGYLWPQSPVVQTPATVGSWAHLALTWDGSGTMTSYFNGSQISSLSVTLTGASTQNPSIGGPSGGIWYVQGLSIWSTCLNQTSISQYMNGADPTQQTGCVANFPLVTDLGDSVNGNSLNVTSGAGTFQISQLILPITTSQTAPPTAVQKPVAPEGPRLLLTQDLIAIAKKNGIDVDSPVSEADMAGPEYAGIGKWFDGITANLPAKGAARIKNEFMRNARIGRDLRQKGIKAGTFEMSVEGKDTVGYYHTETGPEEVYRLTGVVLTPMQNWASLIAFDVLGLMASVFGVVTSVLKVANGVALMQNQLNALAAAIPGSIQAGESLLVKAKDVTMLVLTFIHGANLTFSVFRELVLGGSWWCVAFTLANLVLMIVGVLASNGVVMFIRAVQLGVSLVDLGNDLMKMPNTEAAAAK